MFRDGPSGIPAARFISVTEKSLGIPAIRANSFVTHPAKSLEIRGFRTELVASLCQAGLFHIDENSALESCAPDSQNEVSGGESAPGG